MIWDNEIDNTVVHIEELAFSAWPARETVFVDCWIARLSDGYTKRANSVLPLYSGLNEPLPKIDYCRQLYAPHKLPTVFRIPNIPANDRLDELLGSQGLQSLGETIVQSIDTFTNLRSAGKDIEIRNQFTADWFEGFCSCSGLADPLMRPSAEMILNLIVPETIVVRKTAGNRTIGCGFGVLHCHEVGLFDIVVDRDFRNLGLGTEIVATILHQAAELGRNSAYLQVTAANERAIQLYRSFDFQEAYRYHYRVQAAHR